MDDIIKRKYSEDTTAYDDTLAELERSQNFKSYYNQAIQNYNMKQNTQKYMNSMLQNQGLASQGYGTSAHVGVENNAMNLYSQIASDYANAEAKITKDAYDRYLTEQTNIEDKQIEQDNQLAKFISSSGSPEEINKYMVNYGYMDADGNYTEKWDSLSPDRQAYFTSLIDMYSSGNQSTQSSENGVAFEVLGDQKFANTNGNEKTIKDRVSEDTLNQLNSYIQNGTIPSGSVIEIKGKREKDRVYLKYENGKYTVIDKETYYNQDVNNRYYADDDEINHNGQNLIDKSYNESFNKLSTDLGDNYTDYLKRLSDSFSMNHVKNNTAIMIKDNKHRNPVYVLYLNGKFEIISKEDYEKHSRKKEA